MNSGSEDIWCRYRAACGITLCCLIASLAVMVGTAAAESGDSAPIRPASDGGLGFPDITGPERPEEYPFQLHPVSPEMSLRQIDDQEIVVEYPELGIVAYSLQAGPAHDAVGSTVPTTIALSQDEEGPVVTISVHFRAGNPAAGGAPFVFPILQGKGWEGGYRTESFEMNEPKPPASEPPPSPAPPVPTCTVPALRGLDLRAAKIRLRGADCTIGKVRLARRATVGTGKVAKQFEPAGAELVAGSPVAVKLVAR